VTQAHRARRSAAVIADVQGADTERAAYLRRLAEGASPRLREAVIRAAGNVRAPAATDLLLSGLAASDRGVVDTSLEVLLERAGAWARGAETGLPRMEASQLLRAMRQAFATLRAEDDLEGLGLFIDALESLPLSELDSNLDLLARHSNITIRHKALRALRSLGRELPAEPHEPIQDAQRITVWDGDLPEVRVRTNRGEFLLELRPDAAPGTVARFLNLVDAGFYRGLGFHRVVPGFVVQGGDPRGDGYGGPDFTLRCEDNQLRYERGSVGMALAGRDTGGSQFFVTYGSEPSLDGRYTIFARVAVGMEVVDALQEGDRMLELNRE
jgi:cyclophilin family peptidyl-prolyl cis-trans isomerase